MPRPALLRREARPLALALATALTVTTSSALALRPADLRPDYTPAAYAIKGATIVTGAGPAIDGGTVVVRDGVIEAVGAADKVEVPFDAETIDGKGLHVYPGFLDLFTTLGQPAGVVRSKTGPGRVVPYADFALPRTPADNRTGMTPEFDVASILELPDATAEERRKLGFTEILAAPAGPIAAGQSALVGTSGLPRRESLVKPVVALHIALRSPSGFGGGEDGHDHAHADGRHTCDDELHAREAMADGPAIPAGLDPAIFDPGPTQAPATPPAVTPAPGTPAPATPATPAVPAPGRRPGAPRVYPTSLMGVVAHLRQAMLDAEHNHALMAYYDTKGGARPASDPSLEALHAARTKALPTWWEANTRDEIHRALDLAEEFGTTAVIVGGRDAAKVADRLKQTGTPVVLRLDFPEEPKPPTEAEFAKKKAEDRDEPLRVLQDRAARWKDRVATAKALAEKGVPFAFSTDGLAQVTTVHAQVKKLIDAGLPRDAAVAALTRDAAAIVGLSRRLGTIEPGKLGHLVVMTAPYGDDRGKPKYVLADGMKFDLEKGSSAATKKGGGRRGGSGGPAADPEKTEGEKEKAADEAKDKDDAKPKPEVAKEKADAAKDVVAPMPKAEVAKADEPKPAPKAEATKDDKEPKEPFVDVATEFDAARAPTLKTGGNALIRGATILTVTKGTIARGSILIKDGKIAAVGEDVQAPPGVAVIDAKGMVAMPGMIDTHSHIAIQGGVNEGTLSIVPEVRVKDVVTGDDPGIYRAVAGGLTAARLLHGSANTIGGQDAVIKLKHGLAGRDLILKDGPQGVKFALGENVTRSTGRFPNTRMGVEATIERAFEEGRAYQGTWAAYGADKAAGKDVPPPRRDLRLEALSRILDGTIKVHSHCYRSDEILMLLRTAARHGVRIQSLQHVLEGYKVAAEIAAHGASGSTFSDWWAYKWEAYDAIPFNAALMTRAGVNVCIKSDDAELMRHLNLEAAKMVKYGNVSELQALSMITINPARELGLDHRLGSIEVGKDADIALFNAHPFDGFARVEMTLIDGEVWFQRDKSAGAALAARPGDHAAMPSSAVPAQAKAAVLEVARNRAGTYALVGAAIHPVSGPDIPRGIVTIVDGKVASVGDMSLAIDGGATTVDVAGLDIWPGLIDAGSPIGLVEVGSAPETQDYADSAQFQPELKTSTALHPDSELIPVTRASGVLTALVQPSGGTISGQACVAQLDGWVPSEMVIADRVGLVVAIPTYVAPNPDSPRQRFAAAINGPAPSPEEAKRVRAERLDAIKEQFRLALAYDRVSSESAARKLKGPGPDPRLAALAPYAKGERPVIFRVSNKVEILDALKLAKDLKLKAILTGADEAWKVAAEIKAAGVPVLLSGSLRLPDESFDPFDAPYSTAARLHAAGVTFAIRSIGRGSDQASLSKNLPFEAGMAVAYGLPEDVALRAITAMPAQILGMPALGTIEVGKRADLVITAGHILQPTTEVKALFIGGKPATPESRHTRLYAKYSRRLDEIQAGLAPLGIDRGQTVSAPPSSNASGTPAPAGQR